MYASSSMTHPHSGDGFMMDFNGFMPYTGNWTWNYDITWLNKNQTKAKVYVVISAEYLWGRATIPYDYKEYSHDNFICYEDEADIWHIK
jgi:hypothetical protein